MQLGESSIEGIGHGNRRGKGRKREGWKVYHEEAYKNNMKEAGVVVLGLCTYREYIFDLVIL